MAKYQWDLYEIRNNINKLKEILAITTNEAQKNSLIETIIQYQAMLSKINKKAKYSALDEENEISLEECMRQYMKYLSEKDGIFIRIIIDTYSLIKDFKPKNNTNYLIALSNEDLLEICYDFFKNTLPSAIFKKYEHAILNSINHLHIQYSLESQNGVTYIDPIFKQKYILINRHNEPMDYCVLPHEFFHFLFNDYQSYLYSNNPMYYSQELEGSLANQLFIEYFRPYHPDIAKQLEEDFLLYYQTRTISLMILMNYLQSLNIKNKFRKSKFDQYLNYLGFNRPLNMKDIKNYIDSETADDNIVYNLSYLASTDLFYIYQKDPEMAFYLLENIRYIRSSSNVLDVFRQNHITFMDDGYENFKKYIKKIERQN